MGIHILKKSKIIVQKRLYYSYIQSFEVPNQIFKKISKIV